MTTATVSVDVTCPDWCTETAQSHIDALDESEACIHLSPTTTIVDATRGPGRSICDDNQPAEPIEVYLSTATRLDGREKEAPCVFLDGHVLSIAQALATADAIRDVVETYRAAGGRA